MEQREPLLSVESDLSPTDWEPVAALPDLEFNGLIEFGPYLLIGGAYSQFSHFVSRDPNVACFFSRFTDEFGKQIVPSALLRMKTYPITKGPDEPNSVIHSIGVGSIIKARFSYLIHGFLGSSAYSDTFDFYQWFLANQDTSHITSLTSGGGGFRELKALTPQRRAGVWNRELNSLDHALLNALKAKWVQHFIENGAREADPLFRSLDMAYAAMRIPGREGYSRYDLGRTIILWVSAIETLVGDANKSSHKTINAAIDQALDKGPQSTAHDSKTMFNRLWKARNDFVHGNSINKYYSKDEISRLDHCAAAIFRILLGFKIDIHTMDHEYDRASELISEALSALETASVESQPPVISG